MASHPLPPVEQWQPERVGDIDIRILRNGDWLYQGSHIQRKRMVRLFSTVLRMDDDLQTYLVTPHEKLRIQVDDAPFTAVLLAQLEHAGVQQLIFTTNLGDQVIADQEHLITVHYAEPDGEPAPYILVRGRLQALISRSVFYQLVDYGFEQDGWFGVASQGCFMPLSECASAHT